MTRCAECKAPTCWTEKTKLEKILIVSIAFASALALAVLCSYLATTLIRKEKDKEKEAKSSKDDNICLTESCIFSAASILENMDSKISPCENFYDFACGNFVKKTIIPENEVIVNIPSIIQDSLQKQLKLMLEEPVQTNELKPFQMIKNFYKTCMNVDLIEKDGLNTIRTILKDLGGWPVLEGNKWAESRFDWKELTHNFRKIGFLDESLFKVFVTRHLKYSDRRVLYITNPQGDRKLNLHKRVWTEEDVRNAYFRYMVDVAVLFGADRNQSALELRDAFDFDLKISDLSDQTYQLYETKNFTRSTLEGILPNCTFIEYVNKILNPYNITIRANEIVMVNIDYLAYLGQLLEKVSKRTLANYMIWRFIHYCIPFLNRPLMEARLRYTQVFTGLTTFGPRWKHCLVYFTDDGTRESLYIATGALYVRKYVNRKFKEDAQEMISNIYRSFEDTLEHHTKWMDAKTRKEALDKAKAIIMNTAYPEEFLDDIKILQFYQDDIELEENYLKSILKLNIFDIQHHYKRLREPANRKFWIEEGQIVKVNARYYLTTNSINVPVGILQIQAFSNGRPNYLNYGPIGVVIGHEFTHGFDNNGASCDKNGNQINWWSPESYNNFQKKSKCIEKQYDKYKLPEINMTVNGTLTVDENIADNGGFATSYKAYQKWVEKHGAEKRLPGLNYTPNQLFWISATNFWCSKEKPEYLQTALSDVHTPNRFRIIGSLSNSEDFAKDFHCSVDSKMNPKQKCKLW